MRKKLTTAADVAENLELAYQQMARDQARELEAIEWAEGTIGDVADELRRQEDR